MQALKALISDGKCDPWLYHSYTEKSVYFDEVLNDKHVVLFISDLCIGGYIPKMKKINEGIVMSDVVTIWLPIVMWTDEQEIKFLQLLNCMPWYTVMYFLPLAGLEIIKKRWNFVGAPLVLVMNQQGDVLSKQGLDQLPKFLHLENEEKAIACRTKLLLQNSAGKITEVLRALLGKCILRLLDGDSTETKVKHLKGKYVLLFISCLDEKYYAIEQIKRVYAGIAEDMVSMVLIPMGKEMTEKLTRKLQKRLSGITCHTVRSQVPEAGDKFIREHWYFRDSPMVVMMNPEGEVLSKHKFNLESVRPLPQPPPKEKHVYSLLWGGHYFYWNERFSRIASAVAADKVLKAAKVSIDLRFDDYENGEAKWAKLMRDQDIICEDPKILNVLEAFDNWKGYLTLKPFELCFTNYLDELS